MKLRKAREKRRHCPPALEAKCTNAVLAGMERLVNAGNEAVSTRRGDPAENTLPPPRACPGTEKPFWNITCLFTIYYILKTKTQDALKCLFRKAMLFLAMFSAPNEKSKTSTEA